MAFVRRRRGFYHLTSGSEVVNWEYDVFPRLPTLHRKGTETELIALCFTVDITDLPQPRNNEPNKHDDMQFFAFNKLPENIIPAHQQIINCVQSGMRYSQHGW